MISSKVFPLANPSNLLKRITVFRSLVTSRQNYCAKPDNAAAESTEVNSEALAQEIAKLTEEKTDLSSQISDLDGKYKRALADRENVRNRLEKQIVEAKQYGIQGFCKELLEVTDIFEKAIESVSKDELEKDNSLRNLYDGLVMTESTLISVFKRHKLNKLEINTGDKFNPAEHEAMFEVPPSETQSPGTVAHVLRAGWRLHDRCIRSAQVGVVKE